MTLDEERFNPCSNSSTVDVITLSGNRLRILSRVSDSVHTSRLRVKFNAVDLFDLLEMAV